ncbi:MAG: hypothetical protein AAF799_30060 [Myxococcota bacterium]
MSARFIIATLLGATLGAFATGCPPPGTTPKPDAGSSNQTRPPQDEPRDPRDPKLVQAMTDRLAAAQTQRLTTVRALPFGPIDELKLPIQLGPGVCAEPPPVPTIDEHRSLFVHDLGTLNHVGRTHDFSLRHTFAQMADQLATAGVSGLDAEQLFREFWDTQNDSSSAVTPGGAQCDDDGSTINGFPNSCPRVEGGEATNAAANLDSYIPIGLVNRIDLAGEGWSNCGEYRIVYAKQARGRRRNFMIFEAVLPNPSPGCKDACRPVAEFWADLSVDDSVTSRANKLLGFYYDGLPGFRPVVHVDHYSSTGASSGYGSAGGGQIRTNQFLGGPWTLKEMRTLVDCDGTCEFQFVPDTVKLSPFGELWSPTADPSDHSGRVGAFRAAIELQVAALGDATDVNSLGYELLDDFNAAQSDAQSDTGDSAYCHHFDCSGQQYLASALSTFNATQPPNRQLTARQVVNRATALSCGGCHQPSTFGLSSSGALGPVGSGLESWPASAGFVHTNERNSVPLPDPAVFGGQPGFQLSPALEQEFLPARKENLIAFLSEDDCPCMRRFLPRIPPDRLAEFLRRVPRPRPPLPGFARSLKLHGIDPRLEKIAVEMGTEAGLKPRVREATSLVPRTERLDAARGIDDPRQRAAARNEAIRERVAKQPPRRTVDGTFRVH